MDFRNTGIFAGDRLKNLEGEFCFRQKSDGASYAWHGENMRLIEDACLMEMAARFVQSYVQSN